MAVSLDFTKDIELLKQFNADLIIGIDEVGRGAWAGPVCVGAFVLDINNCNLISGVNDSKQVTKLNREKLSVDLKIYKHLILNEKRELFIYKLNLKNLLKLNFYKYPLKTNLKSCNSTVILA